MINVRIFFTPTLTPTLKKVIIMELRKTLLYFALAMLGVMLWHAWEHDYAPVVAPTSNATPAQIAAHPVEFAPAANTSQASSYQATPTKLAAAIPNNKNI